jgi:hypothetical protein
MRRAAGWILFIFGIHEFNHHRTLPGEYEHSSSKNRCFSNPPQMGDFLENFSYDFDESSLICGHCVPE